MEFELKLEIPAERIPALQAAIRRGNAKRERLRATYFDTKDGALAAHGVVVRMRQENRRWVQTAKAPGAGALDRLEHNAPVTQQQPGVIPAVDLSRHGGTAVGEAIQRALGLKVGKPFPALVPLYETDVTRLSLMVTRGESEVEISLDEGRIVAGDKSTPVRELEIELKQGRPEDAVMLAREGCMIHGLWLSTISKSMQGQRLAGTTRPQTRGAAKHQYPRHANDHQLVVTTVAACLDQVLEFASHVAGGSTDAEHIHQLRVGIRKLRTALRELAGPSDRLDPARKVPLIDVFRTLGQWRDQDYVVRSMEPRIEGAGGPAVKLLPDLKDPGESVRSPAFQDTLLAVLAFVYSDAVSGPGHQRLKARIRNSLAKLHSKVLEDGGAYASLDDAGKHRVRKRAKRLRYLAEFAVPLFGRRRAEAFAEGLKPLLDALGQDNDERIALRAYRAHVDQDAGAWFAAGWLTARRESNALACQREISHFSRKSRFWE